MHARRMLRLFTALCIMLFVSSALVFAGGKQEKAEDKEKETQPETTQQQIPQESENGGDSSAQATGSAPGDVVATVNGEEIGRQEFEQLLNYFRYQYSQQGMQVQGAQLQQLQAMVLESLIDNELMYQIAEENGYGPSDKELNEELKKTKEQFADEAAYQQALNQQGMSEQELKQELAKQMTKVQFEENKFGDQVTVDSSEIRAYYEDNPEQFEQPEQVRASHILIQVEEDASEADKAAAKEKLQAAKERIENGEEFSAVAREVSEGPSSERGGDLNYFGRGQMVPEFEQVAFNMEVGEVSGIVETSFGFHLIKLTDYKESQKASFSEVEDNIKTHLERVKLQEAKKTFLDKEKQSANIERFGLSG
ncbi:MAG: peptidylprolyl isomerase [Spirochaetaceae bacterium]|nr:peptidylprolyl isomerase [Spirochaetaceae bacterium]MCF7949537.1 peptidylprolyl isomerase [Spirochaetia bacterium]MCF7952017.1 peptidylprolyl isomerase [Spirochaetaceae bacterium]